MFNISKHNSKHLCFSCRVRLNLNYYTHENEANYSTYKENGKSKQLFTTLYPDAVFDI